MASVSQTGSRAGLITALVVFVILTFVAGIMAFVINSDKQVADKKLADLTKKYTKIIKDSEMTTEEYTAATKLAEAEPGTTLFSFLMRQRDDLAKTITGQGNIDAKRAMDT